MRYIFIFLFFLNFSFKVYSITLEEVINIAKLYNPVLKQKKIDIEIQKTKEKQNKAKKFGQIEIFGVYNRYEDKRILYPISPPLNPSNLVGAENQIIGGISYSIPLFTGFKIKNNIEISKLGKKLKEIQYKLSKNQIIYNIRNIYIKILSLEKQKIAICPNFFALFC
ncbi:MAG: TolC family protein, partial [Aquificae bacterium]|nr:TolC family protein [Aquificota bacterium]